MFGKDWKPARGTIVQRRGKTTGDGMVTIYEFVVDVTTEFGEVFRAKVEEPRIATSFLAPSVGMTVGVEYDAKSHKVRFDKDDPALSLKQYTKSNNDDFEAALSAPAGTTAVAAGAPADIQQQLQQILQAQGIQRGAAGFPQVVQMQPGNPEAAAIREALLKALGVNAPEAPTADPESPTT